MVGRWVKKQEEGRESSEKKSVALSKPVKIGKEEKGKNQKERDFHAHLRFRSQELGGRCCRHVVGKSLQTEENEMFRGDIKKR